MHLEVGTQIVTFRNIMMCAQPSFNFNPFNAELNPIHHMLALLGANHILHISRIRIKTGFYDCWYTHYTASVLFNRILYGYNNAVGPLPRCQFPLSHEGHPWNEDCRCVQHTLHMWLCLYWADGQSIAIRMKEHHWHTALNNGSMCNGRAHYLKRTSHPNPQHHTPIYVGHTIREATEWAPSQQEQWWRSSLGQVIKISHSLLEGMEDTSQSPQGYAILNIMDLFMATDQPLRY
jgi:hypothetical protein